MYTQVTSEQATYNHVKVSREKPVFEDAAVRNIDTLALVGDDWWNGPFRIENRPQVNLFELTDDCTP